MAFIFTLGVLALILFIIGVWFIFRPAWMGFRELTLWSWISISVNSIGLGIGTLAISMTVNAVELRRSEDIQVQTYIDRISGILTNSQGQTLSQSERAIARAHTNSVLKSITGERAGRVLNFLNELSLIQGLQVELEGLNLAGVTLKDVNFDGLDFEDSNLEGADLEGSQFNNVDFEGTFLKNADFKRTDLRGADFTDSIGLTKNQLSLACVDKTTVLPTNISGFIPDATLCDATD
ncbi:pentapeptide repeat-containing protein [Maritalea sp.]|jgi:hypothetical protein|uniref:pentapeptide repeat-containing protein n=1 Tax=Maritalea sp. TaxID=2003361 RepID=UPI0039E3EB63